MRRRRYTRTPRYTIPKKPGHTAPKVRGEEWLLRVDAHYFCAGAIVWDGDVIECAPVLRRHVAAAEGRGRELVRYCQARGWRVSWSRC